MNCPDGEGATSLDAFQGGRFHLLQPKGWGYRAGLDALLLAASLPDDLDGRAADLGAGAGAAGFAFAARCATARVLLVERDPAMAALARRSLTLVENAALALRLSVAQADVVAPRPLREAAGLSDGAFDLVLTNPPFHPAGGRVSPDARRGAALAMPDPDFLGRWIASAAALLVHGGRLALVARPDNLGAILAAAENRLGDLRIVPVHSQAGRAAKRILVQARRGSRARLSLLPPVTLRDAAGRPLPLEAAIGAGTARIDFGGV
ncbi:methyltransferase [Aureimonas endophytica]|uniref:Methyltransferase n=1 Tax=Aureimonas endophytica TaxID=2027858 RepID=A0A916ZUE3_9HYPH|nr:methyltransferase [Aureimonas endophytica]GGE14689.1 methyltransferase [Aureimonas endophytica]